jgi:hypothetical protein
MSPETKNPRFGWRNKTLRKILLLFGLEMARRVLKKVLRV